MPIYNVSSKNEFDKMVSESSVPIFVKFFATWCGPCKMAAPIIEKLSSKYESKIKFVQIDIDNNSCRDITEDYSVSSVPTFLILKNGEEFNRLIGFIDESHLENFVESAILN